VSDLCLYKVLLCHSLWFASFFWCFFGVSLQKEFKPPQSLFKRADIQQIRHREALPHAWAAAASSAELD
jgi:hypothetical protein